MLKRNPSNIWLIVIGYGGLGALVLICLLVLRHSYVAFDLPSELYAGIAGILFLVLGLWLGTNIWQAQKRKPPTPPTEPLSSREVEVLGAASEGLSNQEIAETLFISMSTVKTHLSSIYSKLGVKRRTQAIDHARQLQIID